MMPAKNALFCVLAALIWGMAFSAQKVGGDAMGPLLFNGTRSVLGFAALIPLAALSLHRRKKAVQAGKAEKVNLSKNALGGILCGVVLFAASTTQQLGILTEDVGKAGFLTAMYIIIVPAFNLIFNKKSSARVWIAALLCAAGLYFLSLSGAEGFSSGDGLLVACAFLYAVHIMVIDRCTGPDTDPVLLSCIQFLVCGGLGMAAAALREGLTFSGITTAGVVSLVYAGVFSCAIAYTLQILGQNGADPSICSLLLSLESVISLLGGVVLLHQVPTARELFGCALMAAAIVLVQLPERRAGTASKKEVPE